MATWKKVIVSGSTANLANVQVDGLTSGQVVIGGGTAGNLTTTAINGTGTIVATTNATGLVHSGSFSGSFQGNGSGLTGVTATAIFPTSQVSNITSTDKFFISQSSNQYITYSDLLTDLAGTNLAVESTDSLTLASQISVTGVTASFLGNLTGTASYATQATNAFTASYVLNAVSSSYALNATSASYVLNAVSSSYALNATSASYVLNAVSSSYALNATTAATASYVLNAVTASYVLNAVSASLAATVSSISNNVTNNTDNRVLTATGGGTINGESNLTFDGTLLTVTGNQVLTGNLTVQGTASFQSTTNLEVSDRFVLFASGSTTAGDGGIVVQQTTQNIGELFGYENSVNRWGFTSSFNAGSPSYTAAAFITTTEVGTTVPPASPIYGGASNGLGNIYVRSTTEEIFIYS